MTFSLSMLLNGMETSYFRVDRLSKDLTKERSSLQDKVELRTEEIQYRLRQVLTASEISKTIVAFRETEQLLPKIVELIRERFELYYVGVFIVDENDNAVLKAGQGGWQTNDRSRPPASGWRQFNDWLVYCEPAGTYRTGCRNGSCPV